MTLCIARLHTAGAVSRMTDYLDSWRSAVRSARRVPGCWLQDYVRLGLTTSIALPQHPDEHRSQRPVLLAVDRQLAKGPRRRMAEAGRMRGGSPRERVRPDGPERRPAIPIRLR
jgi:hypothetical protein